MKTNNKKYKYYVAFTGVNEDGVFCGNSIVTASFENPFTEKNIRLIENIISEDTECQISIINIIILND